MRSPVSLSGLIIGLLSVAAFADSMPLPRYSLSVGRQLVYDVASTVDCAYGSANSSSTIQLTVIRQNADGSFHILIRTAGRSSLPDGSIPAPVDGSDVQVSYSWADVFPDGRIAACSNKITLESAPVLPALPANDAQLEHGWQAPSSVPEQTVSYSLARGPVGWTLTTSTDGVLKQINGATDEETIQFDSSRGIVTDIQENLSLTYGVQGQGICTYRLDTDTTLPFQEAAEFGARLDHYFAMKTAFLAKLDAADASPADAPTLCPAARRFLAKTIVSEKSVGVRQLLRQDLAMQDQYQQFELDSQRNRAAVLNRPLPNFSATDIDGNPHSLADCRGKVLLIEFWYRGCDSCLEAIPQMKQLANDFAGKPVVILGMNTDKDAADARFVADTAKLNYPTCIAPPDFVTHLHPRTFPTLILVDRQGVVRLFDEWYSPTLRVDIGKQIQALLDAPTTRN